MRRYRIALADGDTEEVLGHPCGVAGLAVRYTRGRWSLDHTASGRQAGLFARFETARLAARGLRAAFGDRVEAADFPDRNESNVALRIVREWSARRAA